MLVLLDDDEEVHRAGLGDLVAEEPETLVVPELRGLPLGLEHRRVVERELVPAGAARPGLLVTSILVTSSVVSPSLSS